MIACVVDLQKCCNVGIKRPRGAERTWIVRWVAGGWSVELPARAVQCPRRGRRRRGRTAAVSERPAARTSTKGAASKFLGSINYNCFITASAVWYKARGSQKETDVYGNSWLTALKLLALN